MKDRMFFYRGYLQGFFITLLVLYVWFFPVHSFLRGRLDTFADIVGIGNLVLGALLRIWAVSHPGRHTRSRTIKAPALTTVGPYACVRNPIYLANFLIGLGLVVLAEAIILIPVYFIVFGFPYRKIVDQEEGFLRKKFGDEFLRYCQAVPRWLPRVEEPRKDVHIWAQLSFQRIWYDIRYPRRRVIFRMDRVTFTPCLDYFSASVDCRNPRLSGPRASPIL